MEIIEAPGAHALRRHPRVAVEHGFIFLSRGPGIGAVQRIRLEPDDLEAARQRTRERARERDLTTVHWWVSPLTVPRGSRSTEIAWAAAPSPTAQ
jgi:hypothetical protein